MSVHPEWDQMTQFLVSSCFAIFSFPTLYPVLILFLIAGGALLHRPNLYSFFILNNCS